MNRISCGGWLVLTVAITASCLAWDRASAADRELIGLWHLDGNATDSSGKGHHGANKGAAPISDGVSGKAFRFGGNAGIDVGNLDFSGGKYTVNIWLRTFRSAVTEDWRVAINKADIAGGSQTFEIFLGDGRADDLGLDAPLFLVWNNGRSVVKTNVPDNSNISGRDGQWHMATATYRQGVQNLYIDGCLADIGNFEGRLPLVPQSVVIGGRDGFGPFHHPWIGDLDEVSIYTRVLSAAQVLALHRLYRPNAGCGAVVGYPLTKVTCRNLTTGQSRQALISGSYWNCAGLPAARGDELQAVVKGTIP